MRVAEVGASRISELWNGIAPEVRRAECLEEAAQSTVGAIRREFGESVVLARMFCTVPFDALPAANRRFVERLTRDLKAPGGIAALTPVLSLVGSSGVEAAWCDRRRSRGHQGIPLVSATFVDAVPMIAGLLKELGIPLHWADTYDTTVIEKTIGRTAGLFFVENAATAVDHKKRKIIAAQQFVRDYDVMGVFGIGAGYVGGQIVVLIVFCRDGLSRANAECFMALTGLFKQATARLVGTGQIFSDA